MEVQGVIKLIEETKTYGNNGFRKRLCVVTTEEKYPQDLPIEFIQDSVSLLDGFEPLNPVKVSINLRGREHEGKYYPSIQGWRIEKITGSFTGDMPPIPPADVFTDPDNTNKEEDHDDLPF